MSPASTSTATMSTAASTPEASDPAASTQASCFLILGRQGSGKGTQSLMLAEKFGLVHISTGDLLREAAESSSPLGLRVKKIMDAGELVSDEVMCEILAERIAQPDAAASGILLDGFPRTTAQAQALASIVGEVKGVLNLDVPIEEVTQRMLARNRDDDTEESIARRLALYEEQTAPLLSWYEEHSRVATIDGIGTEAEVFKRLADAFSVFREN